MLKVLESVPGDLTLYVVCSSQCQTDLLINLDTWSTEGWRYTDGCPIPEAATLRSLHEMLRNRES